MPTVVSVTDYLNALVEAKLISPEQRRLIASDPATFPDPTTVARHLVKQGVLTIYQAQQVYQGRGKQLTLGKYQILEKIGEGGMGLVFKARDQKLGRVVALKVIRSEYAKHPQALRRFQREAKAVAPLSHPHIVTLYDADQVGQHHYLALEYVPGRDLAQILQRDGPLPLAQACEYVRQAALGLQHAHAAGLVHRDVKPGNLLLMPPGDAALASLPWGLVKVSDLGLARFSAGVESQATRDGAMIGTVDYMAPEQAKDPRSADARADLYSLGCTLFHLLTGRLPFEGENLIEKMLKHQQEPPPDLRALVPGAPAELAELLKRMMAKRPEERPSSAAEVAEVLAPFCRKVMGATLPRSLTPDPVGLEPTVVFNPSPLPLAQLQPTKASESPTRSVGKKPAVDTRESTPATSPQSAFQMPPPLRGALVAALLIGCGLVVLLSWLVYRPRPERQAVVSTSTPSRSAATTVLVPMPAVKTAPLPPAGWMSLWNGRDLAGWDTTSSQPREADPTQLVRVSQLDGEPALILPTTMHGTLTTQSSFQDFVLRLEYRWGTDRSEARSGVRYLCIGRRSHLRGGWMAGCGFELRPTGSGQVILETVDLVRATRHASPHLEPDLPPPQWNQLELRVRSAPSEAVHLINGKVVGRLTNIKQVLLLERGREEPLVAGRIQLVAAGAEIALRRIWLKLEPP